MSSTKLKHLEAKIHYLVSQIIFENIHNELANKATITTVIVSSDYSHAKIYVTFLQSPKKSLEILQSLSKMIKNSLSKSLEINKCPELIFILDDSMEKANQLEKKLESLK